MTTRRKSIQALLENSETPLTVQEICTRLDIKTRNVVYEDLEHIARSVRSEGKRLIIKPARCGRCDYVFRGRRTIRRPSRCPKCKSEWLLPSSFIIRRRK